jgi:hypothetical protein
MTTRTKQGILTVMAAFPLFWVLLFYVFVCRARFHLGHWPSVSNSMGKMIGLPLHRDLVAYTLVAVPWIAIGVVVAISILRHKHSELELGLPLAVLAGSVTLWVAVLAIDPSSFLMWFLD